MIQKDYFSKDRVGHLSESETDQAFNKISEAKIPREKSSSSPRVNVVSLLLMQLKGLITKRIIYAKRRSFLYGITVRTSLYEQI